MRDQVITNLEQVTPAWLSAVLLESGALISGAVGSVTPMTGEGNWSTNAVLHILYTDQAEGDQPERLFLKMVNTDLDDEFFGASEVAYYTRDYIGVRDAPLIRCYHAAYSDIEKRYHLLLDDLSQTHTEAAGKQPTGGYGFALARGLAAMHAHWWGGRRLAVAGAPIHSAEHIRRFVDIAQPGAGHIIDHFSNELAAHWPSLMGELFSNHPAALIDRARDDRGFTLIHGDVGHNNILVPLNGDQPLYIIDRQPFDWSLTTWLGVYDLAYAMALDWDIQTRRQLERSVLEHYLSCLVEYGVRDYSWEQLWADYRLMIPMGVYIATEYCRGGINRKWQDVWLKMLKRSLTAIEDLECSALWSRSL